MSNYLIKVRHIVPPFIAMALVMISLYMALRWALDLHTDLLKLDQDLWNFWIPFALPWLLFLLLFRKRFRILKFKQADDRRRFAFQFFWALPLTGALVASQIYLTNVAGGLREVQTVQEIGRSDHVRSYRIAHFGVAGWYGGSTGTARTIGRYNEQLDYELYFVAPIIVSQNDSVSAQPLVWYGVKFFRSLSNRISDAEKASEWKSLLEESERSMETYDYQALDHFQRVPMSQDHKAFLEAIASRTGTVSGNEVVLIPKKEAYGAGSKAQLAWVFGFMGIGIALLLIALATCGFDESEYENQRHGVQGPDVKEELEQWLSWFIPKQGRFATAILVDLNVLVFIAMVLSGVSVISPSGSDLIAWGANTTELTPNGEWWRLFTCLFVHSGLMHLALNLYGLIIAGIMLEPMLGRIRYAALYLSAGLMASLTSLWWHDQVVSMGASGAIFGLFGALFGISLLSHRAEVRAKYDLLSFAAVFIGVNLLFGLSGGIDNAAHIGGLICGVLLGPVMYYARKQRPTVQ